MIVANAKWKPMQHGEKWGVYCNERVIIKDGLTQAEALRVAAACELKEAVQAAQGMLQALAENPYSSFRHDIAGMARELGKLLEAIKVPS